MTFMVVNTNNYNLLLKLDFLIKVKVVVDVEERAIHVKQNPRNDM